jgi:cobalt/nickel transport system ATP-binding protein
MNWNRDGHAHPVFAIKDLSFSYNNQLALKGIDLTVAPGERIAILGANGSGKSTLLKILDALYFATSGEVCAFGEPLTEQSMQEEERAFAFRRRVGFLFQDPDVQLFSPTVWDEVTFAPLHLNLPKEQVVDRANWAMDLLGIQKLRDRTPHRLSGGEKKKVALASVLSLRPDVWLLDEPTASLDPRSQSRLLDFIGELGSEGKTIITATHDLGIVEEIADRVVMFCEEHHIIGQGTPHEMLSDYDRLVECNLVHEHRHKHANAEHIHHHLHQPEHEHRHQQT